jgi:hypothetical protein
MERLPGNGELVMETRLSAGAKAMYRLLSGGVVKGEQLSLEEETNEPDFTDQVAV